jgi:hypothetical protein
VAADPLSSNNRLKLWWNVCLLDHKQAAVIGSAPEFALPEGDTGLVSLEESYKKASESALRAHLCIAEFMARVMTSRCTNKELGLHLTCSSIFFLLRRNYCPRFFSPEDHDTACGGSKACTDTDLIATTLPGASTYNNFKSIRYITSCILPCKYPIV